MDYPLTRIFYIGTAIMVTLMIFSGVMFAINQMREIYGLTNEMDNSISRQFESVSSQYANSTLTGIELVNTLKKFEDNELVTIQYPVSDKVIANTTNGTKREQADLLFNYMQRREEIEGIIFDFLNKYKVDVITNYEYIAIIFNQI